MGNKEDWLADDLVSAAIQFENCEQFDMALKYYKKALEIMPNLQTAKVGELRSKNELAKTVYFHSSANRNLIEGRLDLRKGMLVFEGNNGAEDEYFIGDLENPRVKLGRLVFEYEGKTIAGYSCVAAKKWANVLAEAVEGRYPSAQGKSINSLEKYIIDNFSRERFDEAVAYFSKLTDCDESDAKLVIERIMNAQEESDLPKINIHHFG